MGKVEDTLKDRGAIYGSYTNNVNFRVQTLDMMETMRVAATGYKYTTEEKVLIGDLLMKLARLAVSPDHVDTIHDIAGYANIIEDHLRGIERCTNKTQGLTHE